MKPAISFSAITYNDLETYFDLKTSRDRKKFQNWFRFEHLLTEQEQFFLQQLMDRHSTFLPFYKEQQLKAKFIIPILNQVDFMTIDCKDWYEERIKYEFKKVTLSGVTDYMVGQGSVTPKLPYFFIQEFKQALPSNHPLTQLLAELIVALAVNQSSIMRGAYIIGPYWNFVILEKTADHQYHYYTSRGFDSSVEEDLTQIYINLQAVKHKYCTIPLND